MLLTAALLYGAKVYLHMLPQKHFLSAVHHRLQAEVRNLLILQRPKKNDGNKANVDEWSYD